MPGFSLLKSGFYLPFTAMTLYRSLHEKHGIKNEKMRKKFTKCQTIVQSIKNKAYICSLTTITHGTY